MLVTASLACPIETATNLLVGKSRKRVQEIIADNLSKAGWSRGCVSAVDSNGRTIFVADAHRGDGKRFIVRADEKLISFLELDDSRLRRGDWA
jgi:hypothetical protein